MKYFVEVNGRTVEVDVLERLGELEVRIDGKPREFHYAEADRLGQVAAQLDGWSYGVSIEGDDHRCWVTVAGHLYQVEIEDERERAAHAAERERGKGGGTLESVMPGVVIQLLVAEGDTVEEGQSLLILEAMKMQNEIAAPSAGKIKTIHVAEGVAVASAQKLVTIEALETA